ncbi:hypothetical protein HmCmsJML230_01876 [Escherichia coli]|nr:hypothetical protein HmCmsJML230_01876 [Escherichia coli]
MFLFAWIIMNQKNILENMVRFQAFTNVNFLV